MPGRVNRVRTSATKPGTTIVLTLVDGNRKPWITSVLVKRNFTGVSTATFVQAGANPYCPPINRTVSEPSRSCAVPRLLSANSPPRCNVVGSIVSTLLGGEIAWVMPVSTTTAIITTSIATMTPSQRLSVRATTSAGTMPSGNERWRGSGCVSANGTSRQEQEEIEGEPDKENDRHCDSRNKQRAARTVLERLLRCVRIDRRGDVLGQSSGRVMPVSRKFRHERTYRSSAEGAESYAFGVRTQQLL